MSTDPLTLFLPHPQSFNILIPDTNLETHLRFVQHTYKCYGEKWESINKAGGRGSLYSFLAIYAAKKRQPITAVQTAYTINKHTRFIMQVISLWTQLYL